MSKPLWRHGNFRNLWLAQSVSLIGTQVTLLAFPLAALLLLKASALQVSLLSAVEFLPVLLLGLPAGAWVEKMRRRPVLIITDVVRAIALISVPLAYLTHSLSIALLYVVAFIIGLGTIFFDVAQMSYLPAIVSEEQLADGNGKLEASRSGAQLVGPTIGGFLVQILHAPIAIAVDAASYVVSAIFLLSIRHRESAPEESSDAGLGEKIGEGLRFVFTHPLIGPLAWCTLAADLAFAAVLALQVVFASDELHMSPGAIGIVLAVGNLGGLIGAAVCTPIADRLGHGVTLVASVALFSIGAMMLPLSRGAIMFGAGLFVVYLGVVVFNILQATICQLQTPTGLMGRMNATMRFISWGTVPVGASVGGLLVGPAGLRGVFWTAAGVCALAIVPVAFSEVRAYHPPTTETVENTNEAAEVAP